MERQLFEEKLLYVRKHEWDAHQLSIEQCKALGNQQAAYFIQRDLTFRKDVGNGSTTSSVLDSLFFSLAWIDTALEFEITDGTDSNHWLSSLDLAAK